MSRRTHLLFVASLSATAVLAAPMPMVRTTLPGKPGVLAMHADHAVMLRAIRRARAELPDFLELAESPRSNMSRISVRGDIVDWTYTDTRSGRVHSAYTGGALLTLAKEADARPIRAKHESNCEF